MRVTFPNPLGPPITFDTANLTNLTAQISSLSSSALPLPATLAAPFRGSRRSPLRIAVIFLLSLLALIVVHPSPPFPPDYKEEWRQERGLPWTYRSAPRPEGKDGRYLKFDVPRGTGFNHQLQRILLQHHLAVLGNRSLAYEPFVQDDTLLSFRLTTPPWRSGKIPLSAYISTVISGFERYYNTPRAVPASHYPKVCPGYRQRIYTLKDDEHPDGDLELVGDGQTRVHQLQVLLAGSDVGCIRIKGEVFGDDFFDSSAPLEMYDSFAHSPVLAQFTFSPKILNILNRVIPRLAPDSPLYDVDRARRASSNQPVRMGGPWKHILALHLRGGDNWGEVCEDKGMSSAPFVAFNKLPKLPGNENIPPPSSMTEASRLGLYRAKCQPQLLEIIARARRMRKNHPLLKTVYILTDAEDKMVQEVRKWLISEGWDNVWIGRKDVYPRWDDREVGVGVDMEVARRAGVFVGNGFSTTSSNIVLLRSRDGIHTDLTQFW